MAKSKEELQEIAQLVRIHEANCEVEHPTDDERAFRLAIMKKLATVYGLRELRTASFDRPGAPVPPGRAPAQPAKKP